MERLYSESGAETFRARVRGLAGFDRIFAVKCLRTRRNGTWAVSDLFLKTARRSAGIIDSRVARVLEADVVDGAAIAVTEFIHGIDLERFRECAQLSGSLTTGTDEAALKWQKVVAHIGSEIAFGLAASHALLPPLVHGHLCPRNVLISSRAGIKITDVGLLRAAIQTGDLPPRTDALYEAPEYRQPGGGGDALSDVYSLGAILYELATGETLSADPSLASIEQNLTLQCPQLVPILLPLLQPDPGARPKAKAAAEQLSEVGNSLSPIPVVSELTSLVRSFSVFSGGVSGERPNDLLSDLAGAPSGASKLFTIAPPSPVPPTLEVENDVTVQDNLSLSGSFLRLGEGPTIANDSSGLFPLPPSPEPPPEPIPATRRSGTIMAFPALGSPAPGPAPLPANPSPPTNPAPAQQTDWAARALAALGDQAGVKVGSPAPPTAPAAVPPAIHDAAIEEAFAAMPPPPGASAPSIPLQVEPPVPSTRLEDDLVDEHPDPAAFEPPPDNALNSLALATTQFAPTRLSKHDISLSGEIEASQESQSEHSEGIAKSPTPVAAPPRSGTLKGIPVRKSAKLDAVTNGFAPVEEFVANRRRNILLGVLGVLAIGGLVGGGIGMLVTNEPKHPPKPVAEATPVPKAEAKPATATTAPPATKPAREPAPKPATIAGKTTTKPAPAAPKTKPPEPAAKAHAAPAVGAKGAMVSLTITSKPAGAVVWLGGQERGKTPLSLRARSGPTLLVLVKEGHASRKKTIQVAEGGQVAESLSPVSPPMEGDARFRAECRTRGKFPIVVDGKETGILCPFSKMRVDPGSHRIGILLPATGNVREKEISLAKGVRSVSFPE